MKGTAADIFFEITVPLEFVVDSVEPSGKLCDGKSLPG
jgi:hypothetical protein